MTVRRDLVVSAVVGLLLTGAVAGCDQSEEERRADYCAAVSAAAEELTRTADEGGAGAFLDALPTLEELAQQSPSDLKDEWQTYLGALENLRDVLAEAEVEPDELGDGVPRRLSKAQRQRVEGAVRLVRSDKTAAAAAGITQQALDVCDTQLL